MTSLWLLFQLVNIPGLVIITAGKCKGISDFTKFIFMLKDQ